jgi:hypothetical protein
VSICQQDVAEIRWQKRREKFFSYQGFSRRVCLPQFCEGMAQREICCSLTFSPAWQKRRDNKLPGDLLLAHDTLLANKM